jgi:hypothetical protein
MALGPGPLRTSANIEPLGLGPLGSFLLLLYSFASFKLRGSCPWTAVRFQMQQRAVSASGPPALDYLASDTTKEPRAGANVHDLARPP